MNRSLLLIAVSLLMAASPVVADCVFVETTEPAADRLAQVDDVRWRWQARVGDRIRCDAEGREPLDVACEAPACQPGLRTLELLLARAVEIHPRAAEPVPTLVEWRRFGPWGESSELIARRSYDELPIRGVGVTASDARLIRVGQEGTSPHTFFVPAADPSGFVDNLSSMRLFDPNLTSAGGEIFGFLEPETYVPRSLQLVGSGRLLAYSDYGGFSLSGVEPGEHRLRVIFEGGASFTSPPFEVRAGDTTERVPWQLPPLGALELSIADDLCLAAADAGGDLRVALVAEGQTRPTRVIDVAMDGNACSHTFEGLEQGTWSVSLRLPDGTTSARDEVVIESAALSAALLRGSHTWLEGLVDMAGGSPVPDLIVRIGGAEEQGSSEDGSKRPRDTAATSPAVQGASHDGVDHPWLGQGRSDAAGAFRINLPGARDLPAAHRVEIATAEGFPVAERQLHLKPGSNRLHVDLGAAGVWVHLRRADNAPIDEPISLDIRRYGDAVVLHSGVLQPAPGSSEISTLIPNLAFERYQVSARTSLGAAAATRQPVELAKSSPIATVRLALENRQGVAVVTDPRGRPVPGLRVAIDQRPLSELADKPGHFDLAGASASSQLRIVPPPSHVPVCRQLGGIDLKSGSLKIQLQPATGQAILIPPKSSTPPPGTFLGMLDGLPGSDCPMPSPLLWQPFIDEHKRERIRIQGLADGVYTLSGPHGVVTFQVPGPPVAMSLE